MIAHSHHIVLTVFIQLTIACNQELEPQLSNFKVATHYDDFAKQMDNGDTLNIDVNQSMCVWMEYDLLQLTKTDDTVFIQLLEKQVMYDDPISWGKVAYELKSDTLRLESIMSDIDISNTKEIYSPFFRIVNPKEKDTVLLKTIGLSDRIINSEHYRRVMTELYPTEMKKYLDVYGVSPPPPPVGVY